MSEENYEDNEDEDEDSFGFDHVANKDQMQQNVSEVGDVCGSYLTHLQSVGFSRLEAFKLVRDWHGSFWGGVHVPPMDFGMEDFGDMEDD